MEGRAAGKEDAELDLRGALRAFKEVDPEAFRKLGEAAEQVAKALDAVAKPLPVTQVGHAARRQERRRQERAAAKSR